MPFQIIHQDITKMKTDAIVNAANSKLRMGGGVCGAIFMAAGAEALQQACSQYEYCKTGEAVLTEGFALDASYVIHAVGPVWKGGMHQEEALLASAYRSSLKLAEEYHCTSIAFPLISSGIYGYPKKEALRIAVNVISEYVLNHDMEVYLVVFDRDAVVLSDCLFGEISHYIDVHYKDIVNYDVITRRQNEMMLQEEQGFLSDEVPDLESRLEGITESFSQMLLRLIQEKEYHEVDVYKRANIDRKLFSKIKNNKEYQPKKTTVLSLAIALKLSVEETETMLRTAGFSLTNSSKRDVIVRFFLEKQEYDIFKINEILFYYQQPLLGL